MIIICDINRDMMGMFMTIVNHVRDMSAFNWREMNSMTDYESVPVNKKTFQERAPCSMTYKNMEKVCLLTVYCQFYKYYSVNP